MSFITLYCCEHCGSIFKDSSMLKRCELGIAGRDVKQARMLCDGCIYELLDEWFKKCIDLTACTTDDGTTAHVYTF